MRKILFFLFLITIIASCKGDAESAIGESSVDKEQKIKLTNQCINAAKEGDLHMVKSLVEAGVSENGVGESYKTPLYVAAMNGHLEIVKYLVEKGAYIDLYWTVSPLYIAIKKGYYEIVKYLIEKGVDINYELGEQNATVLIVAIVFGHYEIVKLLIENGAKINYQNSFGASPLSSAAYHGNKEIFDFLLEHGADTTVIDKFGSNLLHISLLEAKSLEIVQLLVEKYGFDVNQKNPAGDGPLYMAATEHRNDIVAYLISKGAKVNERFYQGNIALHSAAGSGNLELVKLLLEAGSDATIKNYEGELPVDIAIEHSKIFPENEEEDEAYRQIIIILKEAGK